MADILRIKRRTTGQAGAPDGLANAEIAYNEVDHTLYYGEGTKAGDVMAAFVVVPIAGRGMSSGTPPLVNGIANPGTLSLWSRGDHIHPSDTSQHLNQFQAPLADVPWGSFKITALADPQNPQDAATKAYVDLAAQGLDAKASVRCASTANLPLTGLSTIDGIAVAANDRVLVKDQTAAAQNGIYIAQATGWTRANDTNTWVELISAFTFVEQGTTNSESGWVCTVDQGGALGTTAVPWVQFSGAGQITAGNGLIKNGNVIDAQGTAGRIAVTADNIDIDTGYLGQASIITVGTITTGTWNGSTIVLARGGTGSTVIPTGYVISDGTKLSSVAQIPPAGISGLGSMAYQDAGAVAITGGTINGVTFDMGTF